jgi:ABC-2 type transport system permease protein
MEPWEDSMNKRLHQLSIYWKIWSKIAQYGLAETFLNRWTNMLFFVGKSIRFGMQLLFLLLLQRNIQGIAGYTTNQVVIFFLTYQFLDTLTQIFFRGVYLFSWQVRSGELDFYLSKPLNPLFRILTGKPDLIDTFFLIPTTVVSFWLISQMQLHVTLSQALLYGALLLNGFMIATALHILVICMGVLTTEVDNVVMLYRDMTSLSRFPVDIYREPFRTVLFYVIPVGLMITVPAQVLLNLQPSLNILLTLLFGAGFFFFSLRAWSYSVKRYTSAGG